MAFKSKNFTLDGTSQSLANRDSANAPIHTPIKWLRIENTTGNADVLVGDKTLTATVYGFTVTAGPATSKEIPMAGGGESPLNLEDVYVRGTNAQILHVSYITL